MIKEFVEYLFELGKGLSETKVQESLTSGDDVALIRPDGEIVWHRRPDRVRTHKVFSLGSLVEVAARYGESVSFWVAFDKVVVLLCDRDGSRKDIVEVDLHPHHAVAALSETRFLNQKDFIGFLRHDLSDCDVSPALLSAVRNLKFSVTSEDSGDYGAESVGLGKSLQASVSGASSIPEEVTVSFYPYPGLTYLDQKEKIGEDLSAPVDVKCNMYVDFATSRLHMSPLPGELEQLEVESMDTIARHLRDKIGSADIPVFLGSP